MNSLWLGPPCGRCGHDLSAHQDNDGNGLLECAGDGTGDCRCHGYVVGAEPDEKPVILGHIVTPPRSRALLPPSKVEGNGTVLAQQSKLARDCLERNHQDCRRCLSVVCESNENPIREVTPEVLDALVHLAKALKK